ncbi:putative Component of IIS longevity pathway SMK 1 [Trypanosoma vivax]|uniref:Serine/threonine-protein phosphatase 4 regulatory subunit 3-like central domain-containing protein n=1 Tax=Trypanosoma vivax (strain Y486) TaxID=1055687 RepID=G0TZM6_TRYVY|nr:hypothetical protein TRVL_04761 [Trypanosoma vivax]KAH8617617.1 putative Component of IIS longevity pathway SMK 1 [Trypanosoma vivax]CCC50054.1 conserved hypothetical protein [Trypanosoma vivax Y486]
MESAPEALTKAKLYATVSEDDSWTEMGVGLVSVVMRAAAVDDSEGLNGDDGDGGVDGNGCSGRLIGQLEMIDINNPDELLMSTPIVLGDAYVVQQESILWWSDPKLGCLMACSFNTKEGCDKIYSDILAYQRSRSEGTPTDASSALNGACDEGIDSTCATNGRGRVEEWNGVPSICSNWTVCRENLPAILSAAITNAQRFGVFVRSRDTYFRELAELFHTCKRDGDLRGKDLVGQITLALLRPPYSTDGKIISQFVENSLVDTCIDIVQHAIGRRDRQSGFVSVEERRATFRNPLLLPEGFITRIHVLHACGYLKDLLPLSLDEADAVPASLLSSLFMSSKFRLVEDICSSQTILPDAFNRALYNANRAFDVIAFLHDMMKTIKNATMPLDCKASLFGVLVRRSLIPLLRYVLASALERYGKASLDGEQLSLSVPTLESSACTAFSITPGMAIQMACDILAYCITVFPAGRDTLVAEAHSNPDGCVLELLLRCLITSRQGAELQAAVDAIVCCAVGGMQVLPGSTSVGSASKRDVMRFWLVAGTERHPPLLMVSEILSRALKGVNSLVRGSEEEVRVVHMLRILTSLVRECDDVLCSPLATVLVKEDLLSSLGLALQCTARSAANVQSSVAALISSVLESGKRQLLSLLFVQDEGQLLDIAIRRYLAMDPRHGSILSSSLGHLIECLCRSIHNEKSGSARRLWSAVDVCNPFVHVLDSSEEDGFTDRTAGGENTGNDGTHGNMCQTVGARVWGMHAEQMRIRRPALANRFERVLLETPEEALSVDAETSSVASTLDRGVRGFTDVELDTMMEFGVDLQQSSAQQPIVDTASEQTSSTLLQMGILENGTDQAGQNRNGDRCCNKGESEPGEVENAVDGPILKRSRSESPTSTP